MPENLEPALLEKQAVLQAFIDGELRAWDAEAAADPSRARTNVRKRAHEPGDVLAWAQPA